MIFGTRLRRRLRFRARRPLHDFSPLHLSTTALTENGGFKLKGTKINVPYATEASRMLTFAALDGEPAAFLVPAAADGVSVGDREDLLGIQALPTYPVAFDSVSVPAESRLPGMAGSQVLASFNVALSRSVESECSS